MAEILQPYSVADFNKIPDLHGASQAFLDRDGEKFVRDVFGPLVIKHELQNNLGIGILHRHFALKEDEKLVEYKSTSVPFDRLASDGSFFGGKILPMAWQLNDGKLMPYEFFFAPLETGKLFDLTEDKIVAFLDEFVKAAKSFHLDRVVALRLFPYPGYEGGLELSQGRANIVLNPGEFSKEDKAFQTAVHASWYFEPGWVDKKMVCVCTKYFDHHYHTKESRSYTAQPKPASLE